MRIPWVQCSGSSAQYCIQPLMEETIIVSSVVYDWLLYSRSRSHYSFDIVTSMGIPSSSIYMSHIICISPIDGNHINTKTKIHHALALEAPPLHSKSYDVHQPYVELLPSHIRGKSVNPKIPHIALNGIHHPRTPSHNTHFTP